MASEQGHTPTEYHVVRDQGYGRIYWRICDTRAEAEAEMKRWQRQGIEAAHPSLINGGDWRIEERAAIAKAGSAS